MRGGIGQQTAINVSRYSTSNHHAFGYKFFDQGALAGLSDSAQKRICSFRFEGYYLSWKHSINDLIL